LRAVSLPKLRAWSGRRLMPPQRQRCVPWGAGEILAVVFLVLILWPQVWVQLLESVGFFTRVYGPDFPTAPEALRQASELDRTRRLLWPSVFAMPFQVASILLLLWRISGTRPYQLGLTLHHLAGNLLLGFVAFAVLTPLVYGIYELAVRLQGGGEEHPLTLVAREHTLPIERVALVFSAVVVAPVVEELLFRGLIQRWLGKWRWGGAGAIAIAFVLALLLRGTALMEAVAARRWADLGSAVLPALFVLAMVPGYFLVQWLSRTPNGGAIYGTAVLFGYVHSAWPHPIPLFVLGLGLGWLAYRTQSLVAPILLHALFNGVACVELLNAPA
jgi:membrane protease YdiL (CAAX protease family)